MPGCGTGQGSNSSVQTAALHQVQLICFFELWCFSVLPSALREDSRRIRSFFLACKEHNTSGLPDFFHFIEVKTSTKYSYGK